MTDFSPLSSPAPVIALVGGAVAGSEAASVFVSRGAVVLVLEQGDKPYGKIEDGLPRWHRKLRESEYVKIDGCLSQRGVYFLPKTRLGHDVSLATLKDELGLSAIVLANGAWRDRPLPIEGAERFVGHGLVYQNPFVHWFNHYEEPVYDGPRYECPDGALVVGGGLASIDVAKILNFEVTIRARRERGITVDVEELDARGIPDTLDKHGLSAEAIGLKGCVLAYRRRMEDMPIASPKGSDPSAIAKAEAARVKIMTRVQKKYLVRFEGLASPVEPIEREGRLEGLVFQRNEVQGGKLVPAAEGRFEIRAPLVVSSIGSIPEPIAAIPAKGELYDFEDWERGTLRGLPRVYGLGNVLTGKGNIRDSRENATLISTEIAEGLLGLGPEPSTDAVRQSIRDEANAIADEANELVVDDPEIRARIAKFIETRWVASGYEGDYRSYIARVREP
jgi:ferredoxin/flavodoxin---NADP+ reductase